MHFPHARPLSESRHWLLGQLEGPWGGDRGKTLLAMSACCDDVVFEKHIEHDIAGDFWVRS